MKKLFLPSIALLAISGTIYAQTPDIKFGIKGGLNLSDVTKLEEHNSVTKFHIGALTEIFLNDKFSVQPEILYSAQGATFTRYFAADDYIEAYSSPLKLNYITIPIMAKYYILDKFSIQAGPQLGFVTKSEIETNSFSPKKIKQNIKDETNIFDFGLNFGLGYELPQGVFFEARYNTGFTKIFKEGEKSINNVFQLSLGYKFQ